MPLERDKPALSVLLSADEYDDLEKVVAAAQEVEVMFNHHMDWVGKIHAHGFL